jgi:hypothetical protein
LFEIVLKNRVFKVKKSLIFRTKKLKEVFFRVHISNKICK